MSTTETAHTNPCKEIELSSKGMLLPGELFFLGIEVATRSDWGRYAADPVASKACKKPEAIANDIAKKRLIQQERAYRQPITGYVDKVTVLDRGGKQIMGAACGSGDTAGASIQFVGFINSNPSLIPRLRAVDTRTDTGIHWFGFDIRENLAMMALECLRANPAEIVPAGMWLHPPFQPSPFADPYHVIVPTALRVDIDLYATCEFLNVATPPDGVMDAAKSAELARQLTFAAQLAR